MQNMHLREKNPGNYIYIKVFNNMSKLLLIACNFGPFVYELSSWNWPKNLQIIHVENCNQDD